MTPACPLEVLLPGVHVPEGKIPARDTEVFLHGILRCWMLGQEESLHLGKRE